MCLIAFLRSFSLFLFFHVITLIDWTMITPTKGQGEVNYNYNSNQGFTSHGSTASAATSNTHTAPSNSYLGPSSYDVDLHNAHQHNEQNNVYHSDGGYH